MNILVPKSIILIPTFDWCFINTFSGFKSLWITPNSLRNAKEASNCIANARILFTSNDLKWFAYSNW